MWTTAQGDLAKTPADTAETKNPEGDLIELATHLRLAEPPEFRGGDRTFEIGPRSKGIEYECEHVFNDRLTIGFRRVDDSNVPFSAGVKVDIFQPDPRSTHDPQA